MTLSSEDAPVEAAPDCHGACPDCRYEQRGLPARHNCPECGFPFDEHTRIWRQRRPLAALAAATFAPMYIISAMSGPILQGLEVSVGQRGARIVSLAALLLIPAVAIYYVLRAYRAGCYIALAPDGIHARTMQGEYLIPYQDVAIVSRYEHWIKRRGVDQTLSFAGIVKESEMKDFVDRLHAAQQRAV